MRYLFADCEFDTVRQKLSRAGATVNLQRREFKVLTYLLEHHNRVISKHELAERVWQGAIADATIDTCMKKVRRAVGDTGRGQHIIATRHGLGYELVVTVVRHPEAADEAELPMPLSEPPESPAPHAETDFRPCHACLHFNLAQATFCVRCGTQLVQSCAHCGQVDYLPAEFCSACGRALGKMDHADTSAPFPGGALPLPSASQILAGERKVVTVLCGGLQTTLGSHTEADLDLLHLQMQMLYTLARREVDRYEGTMQHVVGDRFLAVFGAPVAQEDHAQRAVLAALGLHQQLVTPPIEASVSPDTTLALRLGLHTGEVVVGGFDAEDKAMAAAVLGHTTLLATGLQEAAAPGTILCSDTTARLVQGVVHVEAVQPLTVAGHGMDVYTILRRSPEHVLDVSSRARPVRRFVGRWQELATLHQLFEQVEVGRGHVVGIVGEPGIGKSRLLDEFRRRRTGGSTTYLEGRCLSYSRGTPYHPVLDVLRHACGLSELDSADAIESRVTRHLQDLGMASDGSVSYLLHLMGVPAGTARLPILTPQELKTRIYTMFWQLCVQASQRQPLVIAIEDLHWSDATSEELLMSLVEHIAGVPILLLGTYRPGYRPPWLAKSYATQLALQPLALRDSRRLLQEVLPTATVPDTLMQQLIAHADGNPFFLEELAWTVMEHGVGSPSMVVPNTIQAVLMARIDRLSPAEKHLLQVAAVIGKDIPVPLLQAVAELPAEALHWGLERLQGAEFLYETGLVPTPIYTFKHALTQEVAHQSLLHSARQPYHQCIAQTLVEQFPEMVAAQPELLAHHYTEAGLTEQAIPYWQRAGQLAVERSANREAISHFTKGLELIKNLPVTPVRTRQELGLQLAIGLPLRMLKGHTAPEVEDICTQAYALSQQVGDIHQQFSALVSLSRLYLNQARLQKAHDLAEKCFALAQSAQDPRRLQDGHRLLGLTSFFHGDPASARMHFEHGISLYDAQPGHRPACSEVMDPGVASLAYLAWTLWLLGYPEQALNRSDEALTRARELSHANSLATALQYAAILHLYCREAWRAQELAEETMALSRQYELAQWLISGMFVRGSALVMRGLVEEGIQQLRRAQTSWQATGKELAQTHIFVRLAEACLQSEQVDEGLQALSAALHLMRKNAEHYQEAEIYRLKGELLLRQHTKRNRILVTFEHTSVLHAAEICLLQALDVARSQHAKSLELRAAMSLCRLWQQQGKHEEAHQLLSEIYAWFTEGFTTSDLHEARALLDMMVDDVVMHAPKEAIHTRHRVIGSPENL